jgi:hypothetical protein
VTQTISATPTQIEATAVTPSPTYSQTPNKKTPSVSIPTSSISALNLACLDIAQSFPPNLRPKGSLVLSGINNEAPRYILHFADMRRQNLPEQAIGFTTSPDGSWLAYEEVTKEPASGKWLVFSRADGKKGTRIFAPLKWDIPHIWISNDLITFNLLGHNGEVPKIGMISPATGKYRVLPSDFPDLKPYGGAGGDPFHFGSTSMVFDPTLQFVIYPKKTSENEWYIVLWDLQSKKPLASIKDESYFYHLPIWSQDGNFVLVAVTTRRGDINDSHFITNWFRISREGNVQQITQFETLFPDMDIDIEGASISPNGQLLAFELQEKADSGVREQFALLNLETQEMIDYCIPVGGPVWSLDSRYIAVSKMDDFLNNKGPIQTILVDIQEKRAVEIGDQVFPSGWLSEP